eukprot:CAMPEP_0197271038 /NCGR_PEP_ID=MMETSP1432-20130617/7967_1 /TAXON_ID=44447 /ORGANISM="Pseudo-nitzschia delicatissima, Strain UNC1205" /LENGTH=63 /DNA_ID=CAMNT_0042736409 /DNA_START=115 /DNA_END=306 /DNA_ORIENTATION=-
MKGWSLVTSPITSPPDFPNGGGASEGDDGKGRCAMELRSSSESLVTLSSLPSIDPTKQNPGVP